MELIIIPLSGPIFVFNYFLIYSVQTTQTNKLECLFLASLSALSRNLPEWNTSGLYHKLITIVKDDCGVINK
jgi:hypothetical protein